MGRPMATTEPKASSMMMMAAVIPMPSLGSGGDRWRRTRSGSRRARPGSPGRAAARAVSMTALMAAGGQVGRVVSNCTTANAMLACGDDLVRARWRERAGHALTWASGRSESTTLSMAASLAAIGVVVWKTTSAVSPALAGNRACRMFGGLLRRRVARGELVLEVGAHHLGNHGDADDGEDPHHQDGAPAVVAAPGQPAQGGLGRLRRRHRSFSPYDSSLMSCTTNSPLVNTP